MVKMLRSFLLNNRGSSSAEYALILALVGLGIAGSAFALSDAISLSFQDTSTRMSN